MWNLLCVLLALASEPLAPTAQEVVGDLNMPYSGPVRLVVQEDGIVVDVGGNIGPLAIDVAGLLEETDIAGLGTVTYTDGVLRVEYEDYLFELPIQYRTHEGGVIADNSNCPAGKKCCECTSNQGGKASVVCDTDERPLCTCSPCCSATCVKTKVNIEGVA